MQDLTIDNHLTRSSLESAYREMAELKTKLTEAKDEANTEALSNQVTKRKRLSQMIRLRGDDIKKW